MRVVSGTVMKNVPAVAKDTTKHRMPLPTVQVPFTRYICNLAKGVFSLPFLEKPTSSTQN